MDRRQLWNYPTPTRVATTTSSRCTPFTLPSNGVITLNASSFVTLAADAVFQPECTGTSDVTVSSTDNDSTDTDLRDPFYASTIPEIYALAATTVIAWMLVVMLFITPRTFLSGGAVVLGRRGFTNGPSSTGIGIGGRPWLQKIAAVTVAVSLTIATADTMRVAKDQYDIGYMDATALQHDVENGLELKIIRVISDTFLWFAQAQTLIRLFPRQREKIIIKWTAFALIALDVLFSILNNFVYAGTSRPRSFVDAIPALSYLFQLALGLLYCAWVMYYSITKRRYAFYHKHMRNICLVALLSLLAVLVPVVFFVLDISKPSVSGWGDYVRWVGAAAASVVVWEWVERIEALERNDKKDGVLGREVFDGDEMLEVTPSSETTWSQRLRRDVGNSDGGNATGINANWPSMAGLAGRYVRPRATHDIEANRNLGSHVAGQPPQSYPLWPARPPAAATPVSRADTASAESTVYAIRYHPISESTPPIPEHVRPGISRSTSMAFVSTSNESGSDNVKNLAGSTPSPVSAGHEWRENAINLLSRVNFFKRKGQTPPPEITAQKNTSQESQNKHVNRRWDIRSKLDDLAEQVGKFANREQPDHSTGGLPRTVIPAPPRRGMHATDTETAREEQLPLSPRRDNDSGDSENALSGSTLRHRDHQPTTRVDSDGVTRRGSLSFAATVQVGPQGTANAPEGLRGNSHWDSANSHIVSPSTHSPTSVQHAQSQQQSPVLARRTDLPFVSIPAPPRRRSPED